MSRRQDLKLLMFSRALLSISTINESASNFSCLLMLLSIRLFVLSVDAGCGVNCFLNSLAQRLMLVVSVPLNTNIGQLLDYSPQYVRFRLASSALMEN